MRVWGRVPDADGNLTKWVEVSTTASGNNDLVYVTALIQALKLSLGESPFFADVGIPGQQSVVQQVFPDYYLTLTQQRYAPFFASLIINRTSVNPPTYQVVITTHQGTKINATVAIPQ